MKWKMIFKRRFTAALLVLLCGAFVSSEEFKVDSDDLQVSLTRPTVINSHNDDAATWQLIAKSFPSPQIVYSDPTEAVVKSSSRYLYAKETEQCPAGERRTMLTLLLHSLKWNDISDKKSEKAIKKLSRFFLVPKVSLFASVRQTIKNDFMSYSPAQKSRPQPLIFAISAPLFYSHSAAIHHG